MQPDKLRRSVNRFFGSTVILSITSTIKVSKGYWKDDYKGSHTLSVHVPIWYILWS